MQHTETIAKIWRLGKVEREFFLAENDGFYDRVLERLVETDKPFTRATVSRVFNRKVLKSPLVRRAIEAEILASGLLEKVAELAEQTLRRDARDAA